MAKFHFDAGMADEPLELKTPEPGKYTKEFIKFKLETNDKWLWRGILAIYSLQEEDEKSYGETIKKNGVGFNGADANILSSFAKQILNWLNAYKENRYKQPLSHKQMDLARKKMRKYAGQLTCIANKEM